MPPLRLSANLKTYINIDQKRSIQSRNEKYIMRQDSFSHGTFRTSHSEGKIPRMEVGISEINLPFNKPTWCRIIEGDLCLDAFVCLRQSENLFVFGQDALIEGRSELPHFYRSKWIDRIDGSFVTFNDPTLYLQRGLLGGWWQAEGAMELAHKFVTKIVEVLQTKSNKVCFYGVSAGGFFALSMGGLNPNSAVVADIPQVDLLASPYNSNELVLRGAGIRNFRNIFHWWNHSHPPKKVIILMNKKDTKHIRSQIKIFMDSVHDAYYSKGLMIESLRIESYVNSDDNLRAHSPLEEKRIIPFLNSVLD